MRRAAVLAVAVAVALSAAGAAYEASPGSDSTGLVEVVVELASPPLVDAVPARTAAGATGAARSRSRLDLTSAASRTALGRITRDQAALEQAIRRAVPSAKVWWRYQVVLNGFALALPADDVTKLAGVKGIAHVTRSVAYRRSLDEAGALVGAASLWGGALAGSGQGIRIAILDDGIEVDHPFFNPAGMTAPAGFPRGQKQFTSAKIIVARAFPAASTTWKHASDAYDPENSEHGVHVAGIAAGRHATVAGTGATKRTLSGVAPGAYLGNYKVLNTPTPGFGLDGNAPEIAAGIEAAVKDGMDIINLSLGEPAIAPERDLVVQALGAAARAGVVSVVAAGNDFDIVGSGSIDSPGSTPEAITVAASTKQSLIADFSSAGPTPISLQMKPDVTAPGVNIYSSYPTTAQSWTSLSGTSMATPAVAGAVALLLQRHPSWTPAQVKSALATTGGPVYATAAKRAELPPTREGGGSIDLARADNPLIFVQPTGLSFGLVAPGTTVTRTLAITDAGGGAGDWKPSARSHEGGRGVTFALPATVTAPGTLTATVTVAATAPQGEASGFVTLTGPSGTRRVAYWLRVAKPRLGSAPHTRLGRPGTYAGDTRGKTSLVSRYRYPDSGPALGIPTDLAGPEQVFRVRIGAGAANFGVVVTTQAKGVEVHPRVVAAGDENRLTGMPGLPVDLNPYRNQFGSPTPVAGAVRPTPGLYDLVFDTQSALKAGSFAFRYWVNDVTPPTVRLLTTSLKSGATATLEVLVTDAGSGVDPEALEVRLDGTSANTVYDAATGKAVATFSLVVPGKHDLSVVAADFQETRNMEDVPGVLPNTRTFTATLVAE